jgi:hypothetical protein
MHQAFWQPLPPHPNFKKSSIYTVYILDAGYQIVYMYLCNIQISTSNTALELL